MTSDFNVKILKSQKISKIFKKTYFEFLYDINSVIAYNYESVFQTDKTFSISHKSQIRIILEITFSKKQKLKKKQEIRATSDVRYNSFDLFLHIFLFRFFCLYTPSQKLPKKIRDCTSLLCHKISRLPKRAHTAKESWQKKIAQKKEEQSRAKKVLRVLT